MMLAKALESTNYPKETLQEKALRLGFEVISIFEFSQKINEMLNTQTTNHVISVQNEPRICTSVDRQDKGIIRKLKAPFIKIEDRSGKYRPLFKEFDTWPTFDFDSSSECEQGESNHLKKYKTKNKERVKFCECCQCHFKNLDDHLESKEHRSFAENNKNYEALDKLIKKGQTLGDFLRNKLRKDDAK